MMGVNPIAAARAAINTIKMCKEFSETLNKLNLITTNMDKTIYYLKQEVKIGDFLEIKGWNITLTQEIVNGNPDLFEVREDVPEYVECIGDGVFGSTPWIKKGDIVKTSKHKEFGFCYSGGSLDNYETSSSFYGQFKPSNKEAYDKQELFKLAIKNYPIGTRFESPKTGHIYEVTDKDALRWSKDNLGNLGMEISTIKGWIYIDGKWAEIINPLFTTEDGVDIYKEDRGCFGVCLNPYENIKKYTIDTVGELGKPNAEYWKTFSTEAAAEKWVEENRPLFTTEDGVGICKGQKCWFVDNFELGEFGWGCWNGVSRDLKRGDVYFSTESAAEKWIEENKPREETLEDYENELIHHSTSGHRYRWMKKYEPKLYWTKVLQLIADDLNGDFINSQHWNIGRFKKEDYFADWFSDNYTCGLTEFSSKGVCEKVIELMRDNLHHIL